MKQASHRKRFAHSFQRRKQACAKVLSPSKEKIRSDSEMTGLLLSLVELHFEKGREVEGEGERGKGREGEREKGKEGRGSEVRDWLQLCLGQTHVHTTFHTSLQEILKLLTVRLCANRTFGRVKSVSAESP